MSSRLVARQLTFLALLSCAFPVSAWYQVEVIVFQYLHPNPDGEVFADNAGLPDTEGAIELTTAGDAGAPFTAYRVIPPSRYRLGGAYQSMRSSHEYRPLLHVAWEQPGSGEGPLRYVHLEQSSGPSADSATAEGATDAAGIAAAAGRIVDGTVRVRGGRFLHVDVDMAYFAQPTDPGAPSSGVVRLGGTRKVKLNELHYLDHPLFGVLVEVSRLRSEQPGAPGADEPEEATQEPASEKQED